jgi:formate hydrogenlyase subunit 6/NADH:ubiquinone oxidoreductase subunit I
LTGAPDSPVFMQILRILFKPEEARLANRLPLSLKPLSEVAASTGLPQDELDCMVTDMARRGLVIDLELGGRRFVILAPVVIGFFEFTFMRTRDDLPMKELAGLFEQYMFEEKEFARGVFAGQTQIGRALVREESLPGGDFTEVLDWERLSCIIEESSEIGVSLCACRHHNSHLGKACDAPLRTCFSLNYGAEPMIRAGIAERITADEALGILKECKQAGLVQVADNVQRRPTYLCNCCGCCCGMIQAIKTASIRGAIVTSNWLAAVERADCNGCAKCVKACPVNALSLVKQRVDGRPTAHVELEEAACLGCGVCVTACAKGAMRMRRREKRVYTPETVFDKSVAMAIERGKLGALLAESGQGFGPRAFARLLGALERTTPYKAAMAVAPLKSAFLHGLVGLARAAGGKSGKAVS